MRRQISSWLDCLLTSAPRASLSLIVDWFGAMTLAQEEREKQQQVKIMNDGPDCKREQVKHIAPK